MSRASHAASFVAGLVLASATLALAVPKDTIRFRTFDAFAQSLALVEANYVDPVDEQALLRDATRGMLHNLDVHSTYLPPNRYQKVRQDTEGEFGGIGVVLAPGVRRRRAAERAAVSDHRRARDGLAGGGRRAAAR